MGVPQLRGPGIVYLYPEVGQPAIKCEEATVMEWPSVGNEHTLVFKYKEVGVGWHIAKTKLRYLYTEKLVS